MAESPVKKNERHPKDGWATMQRHRGKLILGALIASLAFHLLSVTQLGSRREASRFKLGQTRPSQVKIRVIPTPREEKPQSPADKVPTILETPQNKTERPDEASYVGNVDHKAQKETRVANNVRRDRAKDPGQKGNPEAKQAAESAASQAKQAQPQTSAKRHDPTVKSHSGKLSMGPAEPKARNAYEALLPTSIADLPGQLDAGYQDYVDDKIEEGDRIDISTTEYRYIGYFTSMRKAIELVWNYPVEASSRGMQGEVGLEFAINKDGKASRIRVTRSSGYPILDRAIVEAIQLASPFSPLPDGFGRNRIVVTGSFRYILSAYGSH